MADTSSTLPKPTTVSPQATVPVQPVPPAPSISPSTTPTPPMTTTTTGMKVSMKPPTPSPIAAAPVVSTTPVRSPAPVSTGMPAPVSSVAQPMMNARPMGSMPQPTNPPPLQQPPSSKPAPIPAAAVPPQPRKSIFRFLPFVILLCLILGIAGFVYYWFMLRDTTDSGTVVAPEVKTEIIYWGLWEPTTVMKEVFADFETQNPKYKVNYVQQSPEDYRERLQAEIANGNGPDVFRFHASWVPMIFKELSPLPENVMSSSEYAETFYPSAVEQLTVNDTIIGVPLMIDGLALYYNTDIFSIANLTPPSDWDEVKAISQQLTIKSGEQITRGGIALGTTSNVEHFPEIVALLMYQNGADPENPSTPAGIDALKFYLQFDETLGVWDDTLPPATEAFAKGNVAMMIAPSWRVHEIKRMNANLQFDTAPLPQLPGTERVTWASYWAEGVSAQSKEKDGAWLLVKYLSTADVQKRFYSEASKVRAFGEIYSRKDLSAEILAQPYVGAYIEDAPYAKFWYMNGYTHDNGVNDRLSKYYEDALNAGDSSLDSSVTTLKQGIDQVLQEYGLQVVPTVVPEEGQ